MAVHVLLHQALFGYEQGHNLLESSCPLTPESRRVLAVLTDASGPWPVTGFDHVFTGVPLPDMPYFALFCTWPALEMPRPGCVWSHVLLVEFADLATIPDLGELRGYFSRPGAANSNTWKEPIQFTAKRAFPEPIPTSSEAEVIKFLQGIYGFPRSSFIVEAQSSNAYADLVFALWSQQWPKLRRSFRFSTGSFADRSRMGTPFDLQVTPSTNRHGRRDDENALVGPVADQGKSNEWLHLAAKDLLRPRSSDLRSFLSCYGADVNEARPAFARLVTAYALANDAHDWTRTLRAIGQLFPIETEAVRLKEYFVNVDNSADSTTHLMRAWATASFLLGNPEAKPFNRAAFDHAGLGNLLWKHKKNDVLWLLDKLIRDDENESATAFAAAVAKALQAGELSLIAETRPELIPLFIHHQPELATEVLTWTLPQFIQMQLLDDLERLSLGEEAWGEIMGAMLLAGTPVAIQEVVKMAGSHAVNGALRWLRSDISTTTLPSESWCEALARPTAQYLAKHQNVEPRALALCAWLLSAEMARRTLTSDRTDIQRLAEQPLEDLPSPLRSHTAFLLVTIGLRGGAEGLPLILRGFFKVYEALGTSTCSAHSWQLLAAELPWLGFWREWDRCEKLRRAIRHWFHRNQINHGVLWQFAESAKDHTAFRETFSED